MLPESDLSRRWGEGVRALVVHTVGAVASQRVMVLGSRDFIATSHGWDTPVTPSVLPSPDTAALARLAEDINAKHPDQITLPLNGQEYLAVFKPFPDTTAGLLVLVPRQTVLRQADSAEAAILARTRSMSTCSAGPGLLATCSWSG